MTDSESEKKDLTKDDRINILYQYFLDSEAKTAYRYILSLSVPPSGISVGINQVDFGQNSDTARELIERVNDFISKNPKLNLVPLTDEDAEVIGKASVEGGKDVEPNSSLQKLTENASIKAFLATPGGNTWVDNKTGRYVQDNLINALPRMIGNSTIAKQIMNNPEMFALTAGVLNNRGNETELDALLKMGEKAVTNGQKFPDHTIVKLTEDELQHGITSDRLRAILMHEYPVGDLHRAKLGEKDANGKAKGEAQYANAARKVKDEFEQHTLPVAPEKFRNPDPAVPTSGRPAKPNKQSIPAFPPSRFDVPDDAELGHRPIGARPLRGPWQHRSDAGFGGAEFGSLGDPASPIAGSAGPSDGVSGPDPMQALAQIAYPSSFQADRLVKLTDVGQGAKTPRETRLFADPSLGIDLDDDSADLRDATSLFPPEASGASQSQNMTLDYREITRQVMRRMADESNRPPSGILFDPSVTVPIRAS